ncbi:MAG TPA: penicillin acylase family protein, partial [Myxococcota bacterium]|nr:penicillin acylase family protein [Myxococcota bacterium]
MRSLYQLRPRLAGRYALGALAALTISACGDDKTSTPTDTADSADTSPDTADDTSPDTAADTTPDTVSYEKPEHFPDRADADEVLSFPQLAAPVRVVYDDRGIPHIYGKSDSDVFFAQGFVTARDRIFQMHTLRSASKGRLAEYAGTGSLSGDVFLRMLKLGRVAEQMASDAGINDPALDAAMDNFTAGVNAYLARLRDGLEPKPPEVAVFGTDLLYDWSNVDTMAVVRLQTWDLGFGGIVDELTLWEVLTDLRSTFAGTALEGIELDVANFAPTDPTATLEPDGGANTVGSYDLASVLEQPFFSKQSRRGWPAKIRKGFEALD